ncbi:MAG: lipid A phosphoethanolamine transferase [Muribaculaceae bacterium]|nr:lipid A phosphoethanolamine transferase [Muribaculaceae bacterium]
MKLSDIRNISWANLLMWLFPFLLIVPNVALCFTEHYSAAACAAGVTLPLGVYLLLCALSKNIGRSVLLLTPISIYAAFQIVLLFLYGGSIIAIDMFLNVVTTNVGEATELLANLGTAITVVVALYLPPIVLAIISCCRHLHTADAARSRALAAGLSLAAAGIASLAAAYVGTPGYSATRQLFPVNVAHNTVSAIARFHATRAYPSTSASFSYDAHSERPDTLREVYVLVIGETCRADNWQLLGYDRPTNPRLSKREGLVAFGRALSESNTTHKSVPLMLSPLTAETFGDSIYTVRSIFEAFREAGFATAFFSNQQRNRSFIDFFGEQADTCVFIADNPAAERSDSLLVPMLERFLRQSPARKKFVVLHTYGSHFNYADRYPASCRHFTPDNNAEASAANRSVLINAYDNTIVAADAMLDNTILALSKLPDTTAAAMLFVPDHGEDIFDDYRGRFLHASPTPTYWQIHVPMLMWTSPAHRSMYPAHTAAAIANSGKDVASSRAVFDTMLSLAGIVCNHSRPRRALTSPYYRTEPRMYLNDYNEGVALESAGMRQPDFEMLKAKGISAH